MVNAQCIVYCQYRANIDLVFLGVPCGLTWNEDIKSCVLKLEIAVFWCTLLLCCLPAI